MFARQKRLQRYTSGLSRSVRMIHRLTQATSQEASQMTRSFVPASKCHGMTGSLSSGHRPGGARWQQCPCKERGVHGLGRKKRICLLSPPSALYLQFIGEAYPKIYFTAQTFSSCCFSALLVLCLSSHPCFILFLFFLGGEEEAIWNKSLHLDLWSLLCPHLIAGAPTQEVPPQRARWGGGHWGGWQLGVTFRGLDLWLAEDNGNSTTDRTGLWVKPWADQIWKM